MSETQKHTKPNVPNLRFPGFEGEWEGHILGDYIRLQGGYAFKSELFRNNGIPIIRISNLPQDGDEVDLTECVYYDDGAYDNYVVKKGDLLIAMSGATTGKTATYRSDERAFLNQRVGCFRTKKEFYYPFIYGIVESPSFQNSLKKKLIAGAQPNISSSDIETIPFFFPRSNEQVKIADLISLINQRISIQSKLIDRYESLIKALRHHIFTSINPIEEVCFSDILSYEQPTRFIVTDTEYSDNKDLTPVLTANKAFILGYTDEREGIYRKGPCIILDDFTLDCKIVDFPFKVKSSAIKILTAKSSVNLRYVYEYLRYLDLNTEEHKRHYIAEIEPMTIELPGKAEIDAIANLFSKLDSRKQLAERDLELLKSEKAHYLNTLFI